MRKLIEPDTTNENLVVCDNPVCDFHIPYKGCDKDLSHYINVPCPDCGENLLTRADYNNYIALMRYVDWINKWFSWLTIFYKKDVKQTTVSVHCHDGYKIRKEEL